MPEVELLPGWTRQPLSDVVDQFIVPMRDKPPHWSGDIPWCRIEDFDGKYLYGSKSDRRVDRKTIRLMNLKVFPVGTVLCSCSATLGVCTITARELVSNQTFIGLLPSQSIDTEFLYYKMTSRAKDLQGMSSGTTIAYLPRSRFEKFEIDLPTKPEQVRIAEILSTVDEAIEQTKALIAKTQQIKAGLMHDLFTRGVTPDGQLRPPREEAPHLYKESPLGWIPKEWDVEGLDAYLDAVSGIKPGPFGSSLTKDVFAQEGYRVYGQEQVIAGTLAIGDYFISAAKFAEMRAFEVLAGDVLLSLVGTVGRVLIVEDPHEAGIINPRLMRLRPDPNIASSQFLRYLLLTNSIKRQTEMLAGGGTMPVINGKVIRRLQAPKITLQEQELIVERLYALEADVVSGETEFEKLKLVKTGLMSDLLSGTVQIKVYDDGGVIER